MRNLARVALSGLFITSLALTACGDDDPKGTDTADTAQPDTTPDSTPDTEEVTNPVDQCTNAADLAVICSGDKDPAAKASSCGTSSACIGFAFQNNFEQFENCTRECMLDAARPDYTFVVSANCSECYVDSVRCTAEKCISQCASNPSSEACVTCRQEQGCTPSFFVCAGDIQAACTAGQ